MYIFLFGRDRELSLLELIISLKKNNISYSVKEISEKYIILDTNKKPNEILKITKDLAGIVRISKVYFVSKKINNEMIDNFDAYYPKKLNYTISSIDISEKELNDIEINFKNHFKSEKIKAVYKKPVSHSSKKSTINFVANPTNFYSWKINEGLEIFVIKNKDFYFSNTIYCSNPKDFMFKDKNRPAIKEKYNTSFRLASIMINLLGLNENKTIVDPFCGTGTFLIEGLIRGYDVIGIDIDTKMIDFANKNVSWALSKFKLKNSYKIINGNSGEVKFIADACVFEPYMGPFFKRLPSSKKAKELVRELNDLYSKVFFNLNKSLKTKSRVVCILPEFKTNDKNLFFINNKVFLKNGFSVVDFNLLDNQFNFNNPINYSAADGSIINRKIYILEKTN